MTPQELYDQIGGGYGAYRRPDPRLAAAIVRALGDADTVLNVGAGAGSYEPADRTVVAVEPSLAHDSSARERQPSRGPGFGHPSSISRRRLRGLPRRAHRSSLAGSRERPRRAQAGGAAASRSFHLGSRFAGLLAHRRVLPRPDIHGSSDLSHHGGPSARSRAHRDPSFAHPHDCTDGFLGAYWRRPHAYLDADVRGAMSTFTKLDTLEPGLTPPSPRSRRRQLASPSPPSPLRIRSRPRLPSRRRSS